MNMEDETGFGPAHHHDIVAGIKSARDFGGTHPEECAIDPGADLAAFVPHENFVIFLKDGEMDARPPCRPPAPAMPAADRP